MKQYLDCSTYIDWQHPSVLATAGELAVGGYFRDTILNFSVSS